jgi:hypothetical protein
MLLLLVIDGDGSCWVREDGRRRKTSGTHTSLRGERKYNNIYVCVYICSWYELFSYLFRDIFEGNQELQW